MFDFFQYYDYNTMYAAGKNLRTCIVPFISSCNKSSLKGAISLLIALVEDSEGYHRVLS